MSHLSRDVARARPYALVDGRLAVLTWPPLLLQLWALDHAAKCLRSHRQL
ncbi:hypothetical protein [Mumia zhuanghuii]|nr:hypothetical protein [Mumia zhuanghuii]